MARYTGWAAAGLLVGLLCFAGCTDDGTTPTSTAAQAGAPVIQSVTTTNEGNNLVTLRVTAKDPGNSQLAFKWATQSGQLSATTAAAVQWRVPSTPGTYNVNVTVTNAKGLSTTGSQSFTVAPDGSATANGNLQTATANAGTTSGTTGQFDIPTSVAGLGTSPPLVAGAQGIPVVVASGTGIQQQPVATPNIPLLPSPAKPVIQPLATPTVTPPPVTPPPSPLPTPKPPPPQPGVPVPPPVTWHLYNPTQMPKANNLRALHFLDLNTGYMVGSGSTVLFYKRADPATDPAVVFRNTLIPANRTLNRVHFTSATNGYICGEQGLVVRTSDGGQTWQDISVPAPVSDLSGMVVFNDQIIYVGDTLGNVFMTQSANAPDPKNVTWVRQPTQPAAHPELQSHFLTAGAGFQDTTLTYWVGDGIWRLDADNPDPNKVWTKLLSIDTGDGATNPGDVRATAIQMSTANEIWVGMASGSLVRSHDGGATWPDKLKRTEFKNREFNGNFLFLTPPTAIGAISLLDANNAFLSTGGNFVFDTQSAAADWRQMPVNGVLTDLQINVDANTPGGFTGWGVSSGEKGFYIYRGGP